MDWLLFVNEMGKRCAVETTGVHLRAGVAGRLALISQNYTGPAFMVSKSSSTRELFEWLNSPSVKEMI